MVVDVLAVHDLSETACELTVIKLTFNRIVPVSLFVLVTSHYLAFPTPFLYPNYDPHALTSRHL
jgi:hypothetical protein